MKINSKLKIVMCSDASDIKYLETLKDFPNELAKMHIINSLYFEGIEFQNIHNAYIKKYMIYQAEELHNLFYIKVENSKIIEEFMNKGLIPMNSTIKKIAEKILTN